MGSKDKNIFVSHIHENDHKLGDLTDLLRRKGMNPRNYSITSDKPNNIRSDRSIKRLLKRHIKPLLNFSCIHYPRYPDEQVGQLGNRDSGQYGKAHSWHLGLWGCRLPNTANLREAPRRDRGMARR